MKTFGDFLKYKENVDVFGFSGSKEITPSYFHANTQDAMAMMPESELIKFVLPRIERMTSPPIYEKIKKSHSMPASWWISIFGSNVYDMLVKRRILINDVDGNAYIPRQVIVPAL